MTPKQLTEVSIALSRPQTIRWIGGVVRPPVRAG